MNDVMTDVESQLSMVLAAVTPLEALRIPVVAALGRILREPVLARVDVPAFDNSAMDGFAVRFDDIDGALPARLRVIADVPAGSDLDPVLAAGHCARIMTGAPLPSDADTVVPFEDTAGGLADSLQTAVVERVRRGRGADVRRRGEDLRAGDRVIDAGGELTPLALGATAAAGVAEVEVARAPRIAVVSTGAELVAHGAELARGQIPDSNSVLLAALVAECGADAVLVRTVGDHRGGVTRAVADAARLGADACVFSGGVSAGAYEPVRTELASTMRFSRVAMQPGKPQGFGVTDDGMLLFGLPGNPVSAAVSFEVFVRPALRAMQRAAELARPTMLLPAAIGWRGAPDRRQYMPAAIDRSDPAQWRVRPAAAGGSGSHLAGGLARAEAYAIVPADVDSVREGDPVDVMVVA